MKGAFDNALPFVLYRTPNTDILKGFFQKNSELFFTKDYSESGFVFAPFNTEEKSIIIPKEYANYFEEKFNVLVNSSKHKSICKGDEKELDHVKLVERGVEAIKKGAFEKVVLSRKEVISTEIFDLLETYQQLLNKYATAFVYTWFHPKVGLWMGATPETLLSIENNNFKTMSLAGTQEYIEGTEAVWKEKEIEEQEIVTTYIEKKLKPLVEELSVYKPKTIQIGNLLHLRTKVEGVYTGKISNLIHTLHPTPAVCGFPKEAAKQFILEEEDYHRSFYTGFLGELNIELKEGKSSNLFVNLRCMQIKKNTIEVYMGGGITKDSNAKKEWEETRAKSKAMKSIL